MKFEEKYNTFNSNMVNFNAYGFTLIDQIHNYLFDYNEPYYDVRVKSEMINKLSDEINLIINKRFKGILIEEIDKLLKLIAVIRLYQPFYDGNRRTCFLLLKYYFDSNNIKFILKLDENYDDFIYNLIPIIYSESDEINSEYKKRILSLVK